MSKIMSALFEVLGRRAAQEVFDIESAPAFFEAHDGSRTEGFACVAVTRATITIRFEATNGLTVPKAGYGESNGKVLAQDGSWNAPNVNDAGRTADGKILLGTMELIVGAEPVTKIAATRLFIAGGDWSGDGELDGKAVLARGLSSEAVNHHDRRMSITIEGDVNASKTENLGRCCSFISGIDVEVLRFEHYGEDGRVLQVRHIRGFRRVGRGPHSPFTGLGDEHRMRAFIAIVEALPKLLGEGVPIDMILDQISAHNQVAQIHVSAPLLLMATLTAAYHGVHGFQLDAGAASRAPEIDRLNRDLSLGLDAADVARFEGLRVELLESGFFHKPGYETGRPQKDIKFIRDISHAVVLRLCGYAGPFYGAEKFGTRELQAVDLRNS